MDPVLLITRQMFDNAIRLPELRDKAVGSGSLRWDVMAGSCCLVLGCPWNNLRKETVNFKFWKAHNKDLLGVRRKCWQFNGVQKNEIDFRF